MPGIALPAGPKGFATAGSHQAAHITVTPACFVSNLTSLPLQLHFHGSLAGPTSLPCAPGATQAVLQAWAVDPVAMPPSANSPPNPVAANSLPASDSSSPPISPAAHAACGVSITVAEGDCGAANGAALAAPAIIPLLRATARERLELTEAGTGGSILLSYRVLSAHGYQHLVVFQVRDCTAAS